MTSETDGALVLITGANGLAVAGQVANHYAARGLFGEYRARKAANTVRRQDVSLALFGEYLAAAGVNPAPSGEELATDPGAWAGVTWGLVDGFVRWLLGQGYATGTVNLRLSDVKSYAGLATRAGALDRGEYAMIRLVNGYRRAEARHIDEGREAEGIATRIGAKKAEAVSVTARQAKQLKAQPDTPQGRRDALMLALLIDHGLRVGELARLTVADFDLAAGELRLYRPKVDLLQTHRLTPDTLRALRAYIDAGDAPALGPILRASLKSGALTHGGMRERAIGERVRVLGEGVGLVGLSPHDLRHAWATRAARNGTPLDRLQQAGGWASPAMPLRYVEGCAIANEGVRLEA